MKPRPAPPAPPKTSKKDGGDDGDEMELDEDDLKIIQDTKKQGYCYFKRTLSEKDQKLLDAEQMKLRAVREKKLGEQSRAEQRERDWSRTRRLAIGWDKRSSTQRFEC